MKLYLLIFLSFILGAPMVFAAPKNISIKSEHPEVCVSSDNNQVYLRGSATLGGSVTYIPVTKNYINQTIIKLLKLAQTVCTYKIRPETVTVSAGFISATWTSGMLCDGHNRAETTDEKINAKRSTQKSP